MNGNPNNKDILISFITVTFNCRKELHKTVFSLYKQDLSACEYIVVDGGSTDGTIDEIKKISLPQLSSYHWISEKDNGIYDAMNKGIKMAQGKYIVFINAGDQICRNSVQRIKKNLSFETDILYGDSISEYVYKKATIYRYKKALPHIDINTLKTGMGCVHQCMVTKRNLLIELNGFQDNFIVGGDWDFLIRSVKNDAKLKYDNYPYCVYNRAGFSSNSHIKERHNIRKTNNMYKFIDTNYIRDFFCIADVLKRCLGQKVYSQIEYKKNLHYVKESLQIESKYC